MDDLKLYFVLYAWHYRKDWHAAAGYIFARNLENAERILVHKYGKVQIRASKEVEIKEGTMLYGANWHALESDRDDA